jgi:hypothetical protein
VSILEPEVPAGGIRFSRSYAVLLLLLATSSSVGLGEPSTAFQASPCTGPMHRPGQSASRRGYGLAAPQLSQITNGGLFLHFPVHA